MIVLSTVITGIEGERDTKIKDEEYGDIWCKAPESKTHSECDIPEELWGNWHIEEEVDIVYGCRKRNFWNFSARILGFVIEPDETIVAVSWCSGL